MISSDRPCFTLCSVLLTVPAIYVYMCVQNTIDSRVHILTQQANPYIVAFRNIVISYDIYSSGSLVLGGTIQYNIRLL